MNIQWILLITIIELTYVFIRKKGFMYYLFKKLTWDKAYNDYWSMYN